LITGGRLGDIFGYRRVFIAGMAGFTLASALCGAAPDVATLIVARLLQGGFAALMVPQIMALIQVMFPSYEARRGITGYYAAVAGLATVSGPVLGALLIADGALGLGWRAIFLINVPVGVLALVLARRYLPPARSPHPLRLDLVGVGLSVVGMALVMVPLIEGTERDIPARASIALGVVVFALFAKTQIWKQRRDGSPLVVPRLFHARTFRAGLGVLLGFNAAVAGFLMTLAITLQTGLGYDVLTAGLTGVPFSLGVSGAAALVGSVLLPRFGRRVTSAGPLVMASGMALLVHQLSDGAAIRPLALTPALVLAGIGMGCVVSSIMPLVLTSVSLVDAGSASGVLNMVSQLGSALGVAAFGALYFPAATGAPSRATAAFGRAVYWEIATLVGVAAVSLLLPVRPQADEKPGGERKQLVDS
jgi:MFS family permease